ncbi:hypothetical protein [Pseudobutyrivibrio sp. LB2011]|uniref:hypothetical protein n=1 Tax=Pseudobutyrivibrio sp. LB2011 TaxID=1408312 RepID=UPI0005D1753F|nr:hypothetical protein [Pseudobutyrivibrio sp. LB2011]
MRSDGKKGVQKKNSRDRKKEERIARIKNNAKIGLLNVFMFIFELAAAIIPSVIVYYMVNSKLDKNKDNLIFVLLLVLLGYFILYLVKERPVVVFKFGNIWNNCINPLKGFLVSGLTSIIIAVITSETTLVILIAVHFVIYVLTAAFFCATIVTATRIADLDNKMEKDGVKRFPRYLCLFFRGALLFSLIFGLLSSVAFLLLRWIVNLIN